MTFRNEDGKWVEKKPSFIKEMYHTVEDVVRTYIGFISTLATFAIKLGLIVAIYPYFQIGLKAFMHAIDVIATPMGGLF